MNLKQGEKKERTKKSKEKKAGINVVNKLCCFPVNFFLLLEFWEKNTLFVWGNAVWKTLKQLGSAKCIEKNIVNGIECIRGEWMKQIKEGGVKRCIILML